MVQPGAHEHASVCGLYCGACSVFLATREDPARLERLAALIGQSVADTHCEGCRSDRLSLHCRTCQLAACAKERGHAFCGECAEYPCPAFETFRTAKPHRRDIQADMAFLCEKGAEAWLAQIPERYACPACGTINAAYDLSCRACQHVPSSPFVHEHGEAIRTHLKTRS